MSTDPRELHSKSGSNRYLVRLMFECPADSPDVAALKMIEQVAAFGLRNWIYRVQDLDTDEFFNVNGFGEEVDLDGTPVSENAVDDNYDLDGFDENAATPEGATPQ